MCATQQLVNFIHCIYALYKFYYVDEIYKLLGYARPFQNDSVVLILAIPVTPPLYAKYTLLAYNLWFSRYLWTDKAWNDAARVEMHLSHFALPGNGSC